MKPEHAVLAFIAIVALLVLVTRTVRQGETLLAYAVRQLRLALG